MRNIVIGPSTFGLGFFLASGIQLAGIGGGIGYRGGGNGGSVSLSDSV